MFFENSIFFLKINIQVNPEIFAFCRKSLPEPIFVKIGYLFIFFVLKKYLHLLKPVSGVLKRRTYSRPSPEAAQLFSQTPTQNPLRE